MITKIKAMELKGNKCAKCECTFTDNKQAHFHHTRSYNKLANMSDMFGHYKDSKVMEELDKTVLLCASCHKELHNKLGKKVYKKDTMSFIKGV